MALASSSTGSLKRYLPAADAHASPPKRSSSFSASASVSDSNDSPSPAAAAAFNLASWGRLSPLNGSGTLNTASSSSSPPLDDEQIREYELELFDRQTHFVELTRFPTTQQLYSEPGGMDAVNALLQRNISMALFNPQMCADSVDRCLCITGPVHCGLHSAVQRFCQMQRTPISVLRYRYFNAKKECWADFWHKMYALAHYYQPCIVVVHRLLNKWGTSEVSGGVLAAMHTAWKRLEDSKHSRPGEVWNLFVDDYSPNAVYPEWNITECAVYSNAPSRDQKLAALRAELRIRVHEKLQDAAVAEQLMREYERELPRCVDPFPVPVNGEQHVACSEQQVNLSGNDAVRRFIALVFKASLDRQPQLAQHSVVIANLRAYMPIAEDFDTAMRHADRMRLQETGMRMAPLLCSSSSGGGNSLTMSSSGGGGGRVGGRHHDNNIHKKDNTAMGLSPLSSSSASATSALLGH